MPSTTAPLRLLAILAHPDDESLGVGGALAKYAAEGVETYLVTATRGERGWIGEPADYPGLDTLGRIREGELRAAGRVLGIREVHVLDYVDGDLDQADPAEARTRIAGYLRRIRPQVVLTFDPFGVYGHPDHIAICQLASAAVAAAADSTFAPDDELAPHTVAKLYYMASTPALKDVYESAFGVFDMPVDGVPRAMVAWPGWSVSARIDARPHAMRVWEAVACHRSQLANYGRLAELSEQGHAALWGNQTFYRALSLVNGGREVESDLFTGLR
jgi:LmbE family N-acetylglucosaminyl deacetylase